MIEDDDELRLSGHMRQCLMDGIATIADSGGSSILFHDPSPNWLTARRLEGLLEDFEDRLVSLGAVPIVLHAPCGHPSHGVNATWSLDGNSGYWRAAFADGAPVEPHVTGGALIQDGKVLETDFNDAVTLQASSRSPCPCNPDEASEDHSRSRYFAWPKSETSQIRALARVTLRLHEAIDRSRDRKRRSGIREILLQAVMELDRLIVEETPETMLQRRLGHI